MDGAEHRFGGAAVERLWSTGEPPHLVLLALRLNAPQLLESARTCSPTTAQPAMAPTPVKAVLFDMVSPLLILISSSALSGPRPHWDQSGHLQPDLCTKKES